jgi:Virus neck protein
MALNRYFQNFPGQNRLNNEHRLMEDVIVESIEIMGHQVYYIPRDSYDDGDQIFGEYKNSKFSRAYNMEAYLANVEGFEGDGDFFSKFGLEIRDTSNFVISRRAFMKGLPTSLRHRPQEGDLIYVPLMHRLFEIKFIEKKLMFYSLGNREPYIYEMRCELFRFSEESIDTGIEEIDEIEQENAYTQKLNLDLTGYGNFFDNEVIYQSPDGTWANNTATAEIREWYKANGTMFVVGINGQFTSTGANTLYGNTSHAQFSVRSVDDEKNDYVKFDIFDNKDFDTGADLVLDLSETNPFGSP